MRALKLALTSSMRALKLALTSSMRVLRLLRLVSIRPASINTKVARPIPVPTMLLMIAFVSSVLRTAPAAGGDGAAWLFIPAV